jgi:CBS domain containing-hemolysin-like protein
MKNNTSTLIITFVISILLFFLTFLKFDGVLKVLIPGDITISVLEVGGMFKQMFFFSFMVGITPILVYLTWRIAPIKSFFRRSTSALIVILSMILALILRIEQLKLVNEPFSNLKTDDIIFSNTLAHDSLHFEYYLLIAILVSCLLCGIFLKEKSKETF